MKQLSTQPTEYVSGRSDMQLDTLSQADEHKVADKSSL